MTSLFQNLLIWHILLGLGGTAFFIAALVVMLRDKLRLKALKTHTLLGAMGIIGSWIAGGYYYTNYYGKAVKPLIKASDYPWAHKVIMETKEHIFLFLPILGLTAVLTVWLSGDLLEKEPKLRKATALLILTIALLGVAIALMGVGVSGAVGQGV
ncbi:MAG: hypothetical protein BMS9Abin34_297 [Patescibacteria group bacterium]|nr:MAG: hypothetical protein BMS9Abin34_297 [Patescibacteria group bacterium]